MGENQENKSVSIFAESKDPTRKPGDVGKEKEDKHASKETRQKAAELENEQDQQKKAELDDLVAKLIALDVDPPVSAEALTEGTSLTELLTAELKVATTSMSSVPKSLKFLRPHFSELELFFDKIPEATPFKAPLADVLSILATTVPNPSRKALAYRLKGTPEGLSKWGQEYLRTLSGEIAEEYEDRQKSLYKELEGDVVGFASNKLEETTKDLVDLVENIVPFYMSHGAGVDAVDLLCEVEKIHILPRYLDQCNFKRILDYVVASAAYAASPEETWEFYRVAYHVYLEKNCFCDALRIAFMFSSRSSYVRDTVAACRQRGTSADLKQLAAVLAVQRGYSFVFEDDHENEEELNTIVNNEKLHEQFITLATDLDVLEPKTPEDIYKAHLEPGVEVTVLDAERHDFASIIVNAFVNAGFSSGKAILEERVAWRHRLKDPNARLAAVASIGLIHLWDMETGLSAADQYLSNKDSHTKAATFIANGLCCCGVTNECDPVYALLSEVLEEREGLNKLAALIGLGLGCPSSFRNDLLELLVPVVVDQSLSFDHCAFAALALGLIFVGSASDGASDCLINALTDRIKDAPESLDHPLATLFGIALALVFTGRHEEADEALSALQPLVQHPLGRYAHVLVTAFAYCGSGDVLRVQRMCRIAADKREGESNVSLFTVPEAASAEESTTAPPDGEEKKASEAAEAHVPDAIMAEPAAEKQVDTHEETTPESPQHTITAPAEAGHEPVIEEGATTAQRAATSSAATDPPRSTKPKEGAGPALGGAATASAAAAAGSGVPEFSKTMDQAAAVMGMALLAMGEEVGVEMCMRMLNHMLQYASLTVRRIIPLALGLLCASNPKPQIVDTLSKLTHDGDSVVQVNAILSLGVVSAGTNNSRVASLLRQLARFHAKDSEALFTVRIAQGLLYMGKGLMTLSPVHLDRSVIIPQALGGLLVTLLACMNPKQTLLGRYPLMIYYLALAMRPRFLMTVDENLKSIPLVVRVGQALDTIGQAGQPRTITGFQTHTTPVLLATNERAELATEKDCEAMTSMLEGVVVVRMKPEEGDLEVDEKQKELQEKEANAIAAVSAQVLNTTAVGASVS